MTVGWAVIPILYFVDVVIGVGYGPVVATLYTIADLVNLIAIAIIILLTILVAVGVYLLHWLYRHSSKDEAFVRTGLGGEKVVMGGGALVIPIIHDITLVNMNTVPLELK